MRRIQDKIVDIGAPPAASYSSVGNPVALNNTGQIVGQAYPIGGFGRPTCVAWTGTTWLNLHPSDLAEYGCFPSVGISDAVSGTFASVGSTSYPTIGGNQLIAYYAQAGPSGAKTTLFEFNSSSQLSDMNASGHAVGLTFYLPFGGWFRSTSPVTSTGTSLDILQKQCAGGGPSCMLAPVSATGGICNENFEGNGVREITSAGRILGCSDGGSALIEYGAGKTTVFSLPVASGSTLGVVVGMDDRGRVAYVQAAPGSVYSTWSYDPSLGKSVPLGKPAGSSCSQIVPIAINGPGEVLGYSSNCSRPLDNVYWTWSAGQGMRVVTAGGGTAGETFGAEWLNDRGWILVKLLVPGLGTDGGTLVA